MVSSQIKNEIERIFGEYHRREYLAVDPLLYVHRFVSPIDREIAAMIASMFAYGRVEMILRNLGWIFARTGENLQEFTEGTSASQKRAMFKGFKHRFNDYRDLACAFECIRRARADYGSLEGLYADGLGADRGSTRNALVKFVGVLRTYASRIDERSEAMPFLLCSPANGSACKRMNMFLRWMVRADDGIDMGVWTSVGASSLIMPVDTHVARIGRSLRLTGRSTADWRMADEITEKLRCLDPEDPVKYDFSLCRAGMMSGRKEIQ